MDVHTLSLGAAAPSDFDAHVEALALLDRAPTLLPPIVARLEAAYAEALGADFARGWSQGLPEWTEMPGKINVRRILWLHNLVRAYGLIHFAQERYISMSADNHWVPGARAVDFNDGEMTAALPDSPFKQEIPRCCDGRTRPCTTHGEAAAVGKDAARKACPHPSPLPQAGEGGDHSVRRNLLGPRPNFLIQRQTAARCLPSSRETSATLPS